MEIEAKIKLTAKESAALQKRVCEELMPDWGAWSELETNGYFDFNNNTLRKKGYAFRLRLISDPLTNVADRVCGKGNRKAILTVKGPVVNGKFKQREENEITVTEMESEKMIKIFTWLGFKPTMIYEKKRTQVNDLETTICFDEVPGLGHFIEVEAETEEQISKTLKTLGLNRRKSIKEGYPDLIDAYIKKHPKAFPDRLSIKFPENS